MENSNDLQQSFKTDSNQIDWFKTRGLKVLKYQEEVLNKIKISIENQETTILAACPSAGKTIMAIHVIEHYLKNNPSHKVLVLAHGTTILRTQFHDCLEDVYSKVKSEFKYNLVETFSDYDNNASINVCLPQTLKNNVISSIDLLVVDEAHHFYFAQMIKQLIAYAHPKKRLLLTGTPSVFIKNKLPIIPVTLNRIFDEGMVSDVYVEIAASNYGFKLSDFNSKDELKSDIEIKDSETRRTLDDLIEKIVERLKVLKGNYDLKSEWISVLNELHKTMFVCRSQSQARQVHRYFIKNNIKSALSISEEDRDSSEIKRFKNDNDCPVLIVVGRGILGFNYPELVNVVDMTTSQNIDRIYQLFCRVVRKHPEGEKKLFFKIAPSGLTDYYKYIMTGVLALSDENFYTKYNGKNFSDLPIFVRKNNHKTDNKRSTSGNQSKFRPVIFEGLPAIQLFRNINNDYNKLLDVYAVTSMREVRSEFLKRKSNNYWNKDNCMISALKYDSISNWRKEEKSAYKAARMNNWLGDCCKHMIPKRQKWTYEKCYQSAIKYQFLNEWINHESQAYNAAQKHGWIQECKKHFQLYRKPLGFWTKERCHESALKYTNRLDWRCNDRGAYEAANKKGYMKECTTHMSMRKPANFWNKANCLNSAIKYKSTAEWIRNESGAYKAATHNGWIKEISLIRKKYLHEHSNNKVKSVCHELSISQSYRIKLDEGIITKPSLNYVADYIKKRKAA